MRVLVSALSLSLLLATGLPAQTPPGAGTATAPAVSARAIALTLATRLEADFVYPDQGKRYAAVLRANAEAGAYDALQGVELAVRLSEDLQGVARDGHLRVMFEGRGGGGPRLVVRRSPDSAGGPPQTGPEPVIMRVAPPPVMEHAGWVAPGIAFVRFNLFPGEPGSVDAARKFMADHAQAKTIIFDIRRHRGGGPGEMDAIFPWLFASPTRLVAMATRKSVDEAGGSPLGDGPTMRRAVADPDFVTREHWVTPGRDRRLNRAKVYVLTSEFSASAAEHFALAFKSTKRGVLIGRTTRGANHFGGDQDLGGGYAAFIPVGRAYDPATGKDWEGVGIAPDVETAPEDALMKALTLSGLSPAKAAEISARLAPGAR